MSRLEHEATKYVERSISKYGNAAEALKQARWAMTHTFPPKHQPAWLRRAIDILQARATKAEGTS